MASSDPKEPGKVNADDMPATKVISASKQVPDKKAKSDASAKSPSGTGSPKSDKKGNFEDRVKEVKAKYEAFEKQRQMIIHRKIDEKSLQDIEAKLYLTNEDVDHYIKTNKNPNLMAQAHIDFLSPGSGLTESPENWQRLEELEAVYDEYISKGQEQLDRMSDPKFIDPGSTKSKSASPPASSSPTATPVFTAAVTAKPTPTEKPNKLSKKIENLEQKINLRKQVLEELRNPKDGSEPDDIAVKEEEKYLKLLEMALKNLLGLQKNTKGYDKSDVKKLVKRQDNLVGMVERQHNANIRNRVRAEKKEGAIGPDQEKKMLSLEDKDVRKLKGIVDKVQESVKAKVLDPMEKALEPFAEFGRTASRFVKKGIDKADKKFTVETPEGKVALNKWREDKQAIKDMLNGAPDYKDYRDKEEYAGAVIMWLIIMMLMLVSAVLKAAVRLTAAKLKNWGSAEEHRLDELEADLLKSLEDGLDDLAQIEADLSADLELMNSEPPGIAPEDPDAVRDAVPDPTQFDDLAFVEPGVDPAYEATLVDVPKPESKRVPEPKPVPEPVAVAQQAVYEKEVKGQIAEAGYIDEPTPPAPAQLVAAPKEFPEAKPETQPAVRAEAPKGEPVTSTSPVSSPIDTKGPPSPKPDLLAAAKNVAKAFEGLGSPRPASQVADEAVELTGVKALIVHYNKTAAEHKEKKQVTPGGQEFQQPQKHFKEQQQAEQSADSGKARSTSNNRLKP